MNPPLGSHAITDNPDGTLDARKDTWPSPTVFEHSPAAWLSILSRDIASRYQLSECGALTLLLSAVSTAAGGCYWLSSDDGQAVAAPLNTLFIGAGGFFRSAVENVWSLLRAGMYGNTGIADIPAARHCILDLRARLALIKKQLGILNASRADFGVTVQHPERARLLKEQEQISNLLADLYASTSQRLLLEGGSLEALLEPGKLSLDSSVQCLSTSGAIVARFLVASPQLLADLADLGSRLWTERFVSAEATASAGELLGFAIVLSEKQAAAFLGSKRIRTSALADQFLWVGLHSEAPPVQVLPSVAENPWDEVDKVFQWLLKARETFNRTVYRLSRDADNEIRRYVRGRDALAKDLGPERPAIFDRLKPVVSKFALIFHLCGKDRREPLVGQETVRTACALTDAVSAGHLALHRRLATPEQPAVRQERDGVEMIVERLIIRGPLDRRQLAQTFHDQKYAHWGPMLAQAIASGKVARLPDGRFDLSQKDE